MSSKCTFLELCFLIFNTIYLENLELSILCYKNKALFPDTKPSSFAEAILYKLLPPQVAVPHHLCQCSQPFRAALGLGCSSVQSTCLACRRSWVQAPELPKRVGVADSFDELHTAWGYPEDVTVYTVCGLFPYLSGDSDSVSPSLRSHTTLEQQDSLVRPMWHIC